MWDDRLSGRRTGGNSEHCCGKLEDCHKRETERDRDTNDYSKRIIPPKTTTSTYGSKFHTSTGSLRQDQNPSRPSKRNRVTQTCEGTKSDVDFVIGCKWLDLSIFVFMGPFFFANPRGENMDASLRSSRIIQPKRTYIYIYIDTVSRQSNGWKAINDCLNNVNV